MKKIIKLTETDLTNIVKRVIKESEVKNYTKSILHLLDGFENEHVCGFKAVSYTHLTLPTSDLV